jgi:hypothetical protein
MRRLLGGIVIGEQRRDLLEEAGGSASSSLGGS